MGEAGRGKAFIIVMAGWEGLPLEGFRSCDLMSAAAEGLRQIESRGCREVRGGSEEA